jgi:hypothetical protein
LINKSKKYKERKKERKKEKERNALASPTTDRL